MYTGTMMADLMVAVERAEQGARHEYAAAEEAKPWPTFDLSLEAERETIFAGAA